MRKYFVIIATTLLASTANGALLGRLPLTPGGTDYQAVYDTDLNITWLANAQLWQSSSFGVSGLPTYGYMSWQMAQSWIAGLNSADYLSVNTWRLPTTTQPDPSCLFQINVGGGFPVQGQSLFCSGSEMGHLFYAELGGAAGSPIGQVHNSSYSLFTGPPDGIYWSGTVYAVDPTTYAWTFDFHAGFQDFGVLDSGGTGGRVLPVAPGDPFATVPIPATAWLFPSAFAALGVRRKRSPETAS